MWYYIYGDNMDSVKVIIDKTFSNKTIKEYLKANNVGRGRVESIRVNKSSYINSEYRNIESKLSEGDELVFTFDEEIDFVCDDIDLDVVYEDDYLLLVNKPANIIIHPDDKSKSNTLVNIVANYYKKNNINRQVRFLHRIDKETTGLILFAKDFLSEAILLKDIEQHKVDRKYIALVEGRFAKKSGEINAPIKQDRHKNGKMCVYKDGKEAISNYKVIQEFKDFSMVEFTLKTGRTHQIRVHSSYINHPLLGDVLYGGNMYYIDRVALHSYKVSFIHPISKKSVDISIDLPLDFKNVIK